MGKEFNIDLEWWDAKWFHPSMLMGFEWENGWVLYSLFAIPFLFFLRWIFFVRFRPKLDFAFPDTQFYTSLITYLRFLPSILWAISIGMLIIAIARPQKLNQSVEQFQEGINIVVAMDVSESMQIQDMLPDRLESAKLVVKRFINSRHGDRIGLVGFSGEAYTLCPLTSDYDLLMSRIDEIKHGMVSTSGTAIGNALAVSINRLRETTGKSKVIILISDGESNAGEIEPMLAAKLAKAYHCKVYTIGIGKNGKVPYVAADGKKEMVENVLDEKVLRNIAQEGEGVFYRAEGNASLEKVFKKINALEKSQIKETRFKNARDYYHIYLVWAMVFFLLFMISKLTFVSNALED